MLARRTTRGWVGPSAGGEWMISPQWSRQNIATIKSARFPAFVPPRRYLACNLSDQLRAHENIARVGFNYHFGGPIVAKY